MKSPVATFPFVTMSAFAAGASPKQAVKEKSRGEDVEDPMMKHGHALRV